MARRIRFLGPMHGNELRSLLRYKNAPPPSQHYQICFLASKYLKRFCLSFAEMWKDIKKLSDNSSFHYINQIKSNDTFISDLLLTADTLAGHYVCLTDGSKSKKGTAYSYSIDGAIVAHRVRNLASISVSYTHLTLPTIYSV